MKNLLLSKRFKFILVQGRGLRQIRNSLQYFPENWEEEFPIISQLGFDGIEWIYDKESENDNPILFESGRDKMVRVSADNKIDLENIVLDWYMSSPILVEDQFTVEQKIEKLILLIENSSKVGFKRIIFPLLEKNNINSNDKKIKFVNVIKKISKHLENHKMQLHLETSLSPNDEFDLLKKIDHPNIYICYDMGNSAAYGYEPKSSINKIKEFLGTVHIKDRMKDGLSVPLGKGSVDFMSVFNSLREIQFSGPYSFQVYRNKDSNNVEVLRNSLMFINSIINRVHGGTN